LASGTAGHRRDPATNLRDGQTVTVQVNVGRPDAGVELGLCTVGGSFETGCGPAGNVPHEIQPGQSVSFAINARIVDPRMSAPIDCRTTPCELVAFDLSTGSPDDHGPQALARVALQFDPSAPLRPPLTITVMPSTGLHDGQSVQVSVQHATGDVFLIECAGPVTKLGDISRRCYTSQELPPIHVDAGGQGVGSLPVAAFVETTDGPTDCRAVDPVCQLLAVDTADLVFVTQAISLVPGSPVRAQAFVRSNAGQQELAEVIDAVGFTPGASARVILCNQGETCSDQNVASGTVDGDGTLRGLPFRGPSATQPPDLCSDQAGGCHPVVVDATGRRASIEDFNFVIGGGSTEPGSFTPAFHPVTVTPAKDLVDSQLVTVTASGFRPGADIAIVTCEGQASTQGVGACDLDTSTVIRGEHISADPQGRVTAQYRITQHITRSDNGTPVDCAAGNIDPDQYQQRVAAGGNPIITEPGYFSCIVAVADLADYAQSGGSPIAFRGAQYKDLPVGSAVTTTPSTTSSPTTAAPTSTAPTTAAPTSTAPTLMPSDGSGSAPAAVAVQASPAFTG